MTLEQIESDLKRASEVEREAALELLSNAHHEITALEQEPSINQERRQQLKTSVEQRLRQLTEREHYDSGFGAAMKGDDDSAP